MWENEPWGKSLIGRKISSAKPLALQWASCAQETAKRLAWLYLKWQWRALGRMHKVMGGQTCWDLGLCERLEGLWPLLWVRGKTSKGFKMRQHNLTCLLCWKENRVVVRKLSNLGFILKVKLTRYTSWPEVRNERAGRLNDEFWHQETEGEAGQWGDEIWVQFETC